jgi:hypothetical protein
MGGDGFSLKRRPVPKTLWGELAALLNLCPASLRADPLWVCPRGVDMSIKLLKGASMDDYILEAVASGNVGAGAVARAVDRLGVDKELVISALTFYKVKDEVIQLVKTYGVALAGAYVEAKADFGVMPGANPAWFQGENPWNQEARGFVLALWAANARRHVPDVLFG